MIKVDNGQCRSNGGFRRIVLAADGQVKPVFAAVYTGKEPYLCTIQMAEIGDLIFWERWNRPISSDGVSVVKDANLMTEIDPIKAAYLWTLLPTRAKTWLEQGKQIDPEDPKRLREIHSYLPPGLGWDGNETLVSMAKKGKIAHFFQGLKNEHIDRIIDMTLTSKKEYIPTRWDLAKTLPVITYEHNTLWVLWFKGNHVTLVENQEGIPSLATQACIRRACKIIQSNVVSWELYVAGL